MEKLRVGVVFGGGSREREVSFAGGRTVYDNLNKAFFEAIPIFVDSFGNFVLLNWEFIYKGSIRDFYPPFEVLPASPNQFQVYAESLGDLDRQEQLKLINKVGSRIEPTALGNLIDFAFLCLHGTDGEDGRIQGMLEYLRVPYSGSGILSSAIGMNKAIQRQFMLSSGFNVPNSVEISRERWLTFDRNVIFAEAQSTTGLPLVVKSANQGSSIGVSVVAEADQVQFSDAVDKAFFIRRISRQQWDAMEFAAKVQWVRMICDIREGIGLPLAIGSRTFYHPEELLSVMLDLFSGEDDELKLVARDSESTVLVESFVHGREFSCIVVENLDGEPVALPPTEIKKGRELFDYRSKYLPGLSRKITPIDLPDQEIEAIRSECERLFRALRFNVYARIDGFYTVEGKIVLNDPNTTSGMMPSSFFFHQAAEIGLNPSQFVTYIIHASLRNRVRDFRQDTGLVRILRKMEQLIDAAHQSEAKRTRVAVILGGYSSERHISVESGRNIFEKLSSSDKYEPVPVFLTGNSADLKLFSLPINILLKDNADDIKEKIEHFEVHPVVQRVVGECHELTDRFGSAGNVEAPRLLSFEELGERCSAAFIALHGRPGEDGHLQRRLEKVGIPYNGSGPDSSQITIDKFKTNEILAQNGLLVAKHKLVSELEWLSNPAQFMESISSEFSFPFIAKPVDDGCSSAVKIIRSMNELDAYVRLTFRSNPELDPQLAEVLRIKPKEEFPMKPNILIEELIGPNGAPRFIEITGGMLTSYNEQGLRTFEVFEASEALSEGDVLSLEEKFLAGQGQNITPARYANEPEENRAISEFVKTQFEKAARILNIDGYARIDAFVRVFDSKKIEVVFIEVNSLPGMTPATCIFHQAAIAHYKPYDFIDRILDFGMRRKSTQKA